MALRLIAVVFLPALIAADSDRWPQFRGPDASGIAEGSAPVEFGLGRNLLWAAELPQGHSSPSVWGSHIVLTAFDPKTKKLEVLDLDRASGRVRWRQTVPASGIEEVHAVSSPATATPIIDGERVYAYFGSAGLFAFDLEGKPLWNAPLPVAKTSYGSGTSPALSGDAVILARDNAGERTLLAFERTTGRALWKAPLGGVEGGGRGGHATPIVWKDQVVLHQTGALTAYDRRDGTRRWSITVASAGTGTPVIEGNTLYVAAWQGAEDLMDPMPEWNALVQKYDKDGDGLVSKDEFPADLAIMRRVDAGNTPGAIVTVKQFFEIFLDHNKDGKVSKNEWDGFLLGMKLMFAQPHGLLAIRLDSEKREIIWKEARSVPEVPMPLVLRGRVYAVTNGGIVTALVADSGKVIYRGRLGAGGLYYSSPIAAAGRIYFASGEGVVSVIDAASDEFEGRSTQRPGRAYFRHAGNRRWEDLRADYGPSVRIRKSLERCKS